ncbi:glycosyltransferase family 2 protein [Larkinella rosea]|uniref:Glycosyltransferase n=1 Tax=Larkinella rosea TaxID=2025312 RepID=A0A3P1BKN3_9BACT|nr:glycosyltransferase [Larkinella rosea]RRB01244.1 glycosyltransferase [Larkinella rosea]
MKHHFPEVTLLITHYNRSGSLERLLKAFQDLNCSFGEIIVSDDASKPEHQQAIQKMLETYAFRLVGTPKNKGLANNINKGQDAVKTPYTLYVQEDFVPKASFAEHFHDALMIMKQESDLDIVRFYAYHPYPYMKPYKNGFSHMLYKPGIWHADHLKFYYYSDHPHLRRSSFLDKFGRYMEGIQSDKAEFLMCLSFLHKKGKGLFLTNFSEMFDQVNSSAEPSTIGRSDWRQNKSILFLFVRWFYLKFRLVKNSFELATTK